MSVFQSYGESSTFENACCRVLRENPFVERLHKNRDAIPLIRVDSERVESEMDRSSPLLKVLFLTFGLWPIHRMAENGACPLVEPDGARIARRNIIGLSAILILAGFAGVDPRNLVLFGLDLDAGGRGAIVVLLGVGAAQVYWYCVKYFHMRDDAKANSSPPDQHDHLLRLAANPDVSLKQASANWISNMAAFALTLGSWWFMYYWIVAAPTS